LAGFGAFLLVAIVTTLTSGFLVLPLPVAATAILVIEALAAASIGLTIAAILLAMQERAGEHEAG